MIYSSDHSVKEVYMDGLKQLAIYILITFLMANQAIGECKRCKLIESERAAEQKNNIQSTRPYSREIADKDQVVTKISEKQNAYNYSALLTIFKTGFLETLNQSFTLFIPSNEAFKQMSPQTFLFLTLQQNSEELAALVSNHIVAKKILKNDFMDNNGSEIKALSGRNLTLEYKNEVMFIDGVRILRSEPAGYNGIIYILDGVLKGVVLPEP